MMSTEVKQPTIELRQPKFQFGDRVESTDGNVFFVEQMTYTISGNFQYAAIGCYSWPENHLELYQEPKKKKLYAYRVLKSRNIEFRDTETSLEHIEAPSSESRGVYFLNKGCIEERAPEYDIEYPEDK